MYIYVCIYVCMYVCIFIQAHKYMCMYIYGCTHLHTHAQTHTHPLPHTRIHTHTHTQEHLHPRTWLKSNTARLRRIHERPSTAFKKKNYKCQKSVMSYEDGRRYPQQTRGYLCNTLWSIAATHYELSLQRTTHDRVIWDTVIWLRHDCTGVI